MDDSGDANGERGEENGCPHDADLHPRGKQYRHVLRAVRGFGIRRPADLTAARARDYIARLATSGASWSWIGLNITVLRTVFDRLCGLSVTGGMVTPKRGFRLPEILNENEAMSLVQAAGTVRAILRKACKSAGVGRPVCVMSLRHSYAVRRLENGLNLRELQQELGHASVRTTERYRHCLAPKVENHPFSKVRRLQAHHSQPSPLQGSGPPVHSSRTPQVSGLIPQPSHTPPLSGLDTISLSGLCLPFAPANGDSPAAAFLRFLTNRLFGGLVRRRRPRSP